MIERLQRQVDQHEQQLGDQLRRVGYLENETERTRKRLHRMESDRRAMQALVRTTQKLADQTASLAATVGTGVAQGERLAESAAEKAVEKAFARRAASRWKIAGRLASHVVAITSVATVVVYVIFR